MYRKSVTGIKIHVLNLTLYIHKQNINFKNLNKMQKMIFSAIALVAFSFAGMANEMDEKKVEERNKNAETSIGCEHCYDYADSLDDGSDRTNQTWLNNLNACKTANGCEPELPKKITSAD